MYYRKKKSVSALFIKTIIIGTEPDVSIICLSVRECETIYFLKL